MDDKKVERAVETNGRAKNVKEVVAGGRMRRRSWW
jgi:hypothetical protein